MQFFVMLKCRMALGLVVVAKKSLHEKNSSSLSNLLCLLPIPVRTGFCKPAQD
jgi:hypothetical protein